MLLDRKFATGTNLSKGSRFYYPSSSDEVAPLEVERKNETSWESGCACFQKWEAVLELPDEVCEYQYYWARTGGQSDYVRHHQSCNRRCGAAKKLRAESSPGMEKCLYYHDMGVVMELSDRRLAGFAVLLSGSYCTESECPRSSSDWDEPQRCWCYDAEALEKELKRRGLLPS